MELTAQALKYEMAAYNLATFPLAILGTIGALVILILCLAEACLQQEPSERAREALRRNAYRSLLGTGIIRRGSRGEGRRLSPDSVLPPLLPPDTPLPHLRRWPHPGFTILAMMWAVGAVFCWKLWNYDSGLYRTLTALTALQCLLLISYAFDHRIQAPHTSLAPFRLAGLALILVVLGPYPFLAAMTGQTWPAQSVIGLQPGPTAMLTIGVAMLLPVRQAVPILAVPLLWMLVISIKAPKIGMTHDMISLPVLFLGVVFVMTAPMSRD